MKWLLIFAELCGFSAVPAFGAGEASGPSSRRTGLVISEIMYHPADLGENLEFIELHNANPWPEDLSGYQLSGDISVIFPPNTVVLADGYVVVADKYANFIAIYGSSNVLGASFSPSLPNSGGTVQLRDRLGAILLEVNYGTDAPWPVLPDGKGYSLVLVRPSLGEADPRAWASSEEVGGSPGRAEPLPANPLRAVVINELLANSAPPELDFIELYNRGTQDVDVSGCSLSNDPNVNKFVFQGAVIRAGSYLALDELCCLGFRLKADGDTLYFRGPTNAIIDAVRYGPQLKGVSLGRVPEGGPDFYPLSPSTPFARNDTLYASEVVINEIMYAPISGNSDDEYVELYNRGTNAVDVSGWWLTDAISFNIPANVSIPPDGFLVVARNANRLLAAYPQLSSANTTGNYSGSLPNDGARIALAKPQLVVNNGVTNTVYAVADEVTYGTGGRWGRWSHGGGSSLELIDARSENRLAANWADSGETGTAPWTTVEITGALDNGVAQTTTQLQILLLGAGECLVDNVEVFQSGGANLVPNGAFEGGLANWAIQGNHQRSDLAPDGFGGSAHSLHLRASGPGDTGPNHAAIQLPFPLTSGTATIRAQVKWLRGQPDILLRLSGNYLEAAGHLTVPANLGTPGLPNSGALANSGPALFDVRHTPILPAAAQPVVVSAQVDDPDGLGSVQLHYRLDPGSNVLTVPMVDDGTGGDLLAGDGLYSATIPGQASGTLVAFYAQASDRFSPPATNRFPSDAPQRECLVRFGETPASGAFGAYRLWLTSSNLARWTTREKFSDEPVDCTYVYGNERVIYNATARYGGDPSRRGSFLSPTNGLSAVVVALPADDRLLGSEELVLEPVDPSADGTALREMTVFWMAEQLGLPANHDRFVQLVVNGVPNASRGVPIFLDREVPNSGYLASRFSNDSAGELFEISDWFEFSDGPNPTFTSLVGADLSNYLTTGGVKKQARYRWNWRKRPESSGALDDDYRSLFDLVDTVNAPDSTYLSYVNGSVSDEWISALAFRHAVVDPDGYGYSLGHNQFAYKSAGQPWKMVFNRFQFAMGAGGSPTADLFYTSDPTMGRLYNQPEFRRKFLQTLQRMANGPLLNPLVDPILDTRYQALATNGISTNSPAAIKSWISQRRTFILSQIPSALFAITGSTNITVSNNLVRITGTGDLGLQSIYVAGSSYSPSWQTPINWSILLLVAPGANNLVLYPNGSVSGAVSLTVNYVGAACPGPAGLIAINEIMYNPIVPGASYVELYNTSPSCSFDLSNWRLDGVEFIFPGQTYLTNGGYLVLARDASAFISAYGVGIPIAGKFSGELDLNGETLALVKPGATPLDDVIVDRVRYESVLPWPVGSNGVATAASIQLIDPNQDHSRPCNWFTGYSPAVWSAATNIVGSTNRGWQFASKGGVNNGTNALLLYLEAPGDVYIDDLSLVDGTNAGVGFNFVRQGDFEAPSLDTNLWMVGTNYLNSSISSDVAHSGSNSLHLVSSAPGFGYVPLRGIEQILSPTPTNGESCTISFWYYVTSSASNCSIRLSSNLILRTNVQPVIIPDKYIPAQLITPAVASATPGRANTGATNLLPAIPPLWLNEVQPNNPDGFRDNTGTPQPWVELFNSGTNVILLDGYFLANSYTNLSQWDLPTGAVIAPGEFRVIFADGQPELSTGTVLHTSFRLNSATGSVALARSVAGQMQVLDYLNYSPLAAGRSHGSFPNGQIFDRGVLNAPTPGAPNRPPPVFINEWMAKNNATIRDPADGQYHDWFELYNDTGQTIDLSRYYLVSSTNYWAIPARTIIPASGFLLVWADNALRPNGGDPADLHAPFTLSRRGSRIQLLSTIGAPIDDVTFGGQSTDVSQGRWPDGAPGFYTLKRPTPRLSNVFSKPSPPTLFLPYTSWTIITGQTFDFYATATDAEAPAGAISFSLAPGFPAGAAIDLVSGHFSWTPTSAQAPTTNVITVRVTDNGAPPLSATAKVTIVVLPPNLPPVLAAISNRTILLGQTLSFTASATDPDSGQSLTYSLLPGFPAGAAIDPASGLFQWTPGSAQLPSASQITIKVADNGVPSLSDSKSFTVLVRLPPVTARQTNPGKVALTFPTIIGRSYAIEYKDNLSAPTWGGAGTILANSTNTSVILQSSFALPQRFYRIVSY